MAKSTMFHDLGPELAFLLCFVLGFAFLRLDLMLQKRGGKKGQAVERLASDKSCDPCLKKTIEAESSLEDIVAIWRRVQDAAPTPADCWKCVVEALLDQDPENVVKEVVRHVRRHPAELSNARTVAIALEVLARAGYIKQMEELRQAFLNASIKIQTSAHVYEVLLGGYASAADECKVKQIFSEMKACRAKVTARAMSLVIKGFLKHGLADAVAETFKEMWNVHGFQVPSYAVSQLFRVACDAGRGDEIFEKVREVVSLTPEAVAVLLDDCMKRQNLEFARRVEKFARECPTPCLGIAAYDTLLKMCVSAADPHAFQLFREMQETGVRISEGLCVGIIARCAESRFLRFAEEIVAFCRSRGAMTVALYSAFMKVYAFSGMYDKACDLYDQMRKEGLQPDSMMYGCLMKFAVECGRTDLSRNIGELAPVLDIQNYMSLIRACNRDKDVDRAFAVLDKLKASGIASDLAAYNCVLDVCVSAGEMGRARKLVQEMKERSRVDQVTYNTLLKGVVRMGDLAGAKRLLAEMEKEGVPPNDVSYNCVLNAAVSGKEVQNLSEGWKIIDIMERNGIHADHYTVSIMMKAVKRSRNPGREVQRTLALLDRTGVDLCSDEVLFSTALETCIRHRELRRLESILELYSKSRLIPSVHTYGILIKACSTLKRLPACWGHWRNMVEQRGMTPNEISLGCMLDALVCAEQIDQAIDLLSDWKERVPPNLIMYSTIFKGLAATRQSERAMTLWREMHQDGVKMNVVIYNAVIDAQARIGAMSNISELLGGMEKAKVPLDSISHSTIVKGYCVKGDLDMAMKVLRDMQEHDLATNGIVYNTIIDGCTRHNRWDIADQVLEDMENFNIEATSYTVGVVVKMYGKRKMLNKAIEAYETLQRKWNIASNSQTHTCLISACMSNGAVDKAFDIFNQTKDTAYGTDGKAFAAMVAGCTRYGQLNKAVDLIDEAYGLQGQRKLLRGQNIEEETLHRLVAALVKRGQCASVAVPLLDRLRAAGYRVKEKLYTAVLGEGGCPPDSQ